MSHTFLTQLLPQTYQALFRINFASKTHQTTQYDGVTNFKMNIAMGICDIAFDALFEDTKNLVAKGVKKDIKHKIDMASSDEDKDNARSYGNKRLDALKSWLKSDRPLAYGKDEGHQTFDFLVRAIAEDERAISRGLPGWANNSKTHADFAQSLIDMSDPSTPAALEAPVLKDGSFLPVLKVARASILEIVHMEGIVSKEIFLNAAIRTAINVFQINFFPAHRENTGSRGARHRVPVYNCWGNLGLRSSSDIPAFITDLPSPSLSPEPETIAYNNAVAFDCTARWQVADIDLKSLKKYLNRTTLPSDFTLPTKAKVAYVDDTYTWAKDSYRGENKLHHLALLVSIITATSLLPRIFPPVNSRPEFADARTKAQVREVYDKLPWCERDKGGMREKGIFVCMITSFIMALYDKQSPLREHMRTGGLKGGLGNPWTYKNSEHKNATLFLSPSFSHSIVSVAVKGITYALLVRLGVLWGKGAGACDKGVFGKSYGCHSEDEIASIYDKLVELLNADDPFAPFDTLTLLIGDTGARYFCGEHLGFFQRPKPVLSSSCHGFNPLALD